MPYHLRFLLPLSLLVVTAYTGTALFVAPSFAAAAKKQPKHNKKSNQTSTQSNDDEGQNNKNPEDEDQNPTKSLFDAINVGNMMDVQDALNRGADLHATNVLGQTPLEMSVDLNRDRITFLLLSMRGYNNSPQTLTSSSTYSSGVAAKNNTGHVSARDKSKKTVYNKLPPKPEIGFLGFQNH